MRDERFVRTGHRPRRSTTTRRLVRAGCSVLLLTATVGLGRTAAASAGAPVTCGSVLTGSVTLTGDLTCPGDALIVGADDVTIDLAGHTLQGAGTGTGVQVSSQGTAWTGTVIRDGRIEGFATSVGDDALTPHITVALRDMTITGGPVKLRGGAWPELSISGSPRRCDVDAVDARQVRLTIDGCTLHRVSARSTYTTLTSSRVISGSLSFNENNAALVTGNVFDNAPISADNNSWNVVLRDNVFKNADIAVRAGWAPDTLIEDNTFKNNSIGVYGYLMDATIARNRFIGNRTAGIYVRDSTTSSFIDNVFKGNGHDPSGLTDEAGLPVRGAIHIGRRSSPITLTGNVGKHNDGYFVWITPPSGAIDGGGNRGRPCGPQPLPLTCH
ncbi:right-handed parallel beta-helix repeat-containing protein [Nonomuraea sp. NPDC050227]|uniref:right-handed parallel beta-helix repeat-containing protein n=1 Tax=Nonomuraea sp. NPDC050227 TaxID=3364360 RepID=UPI0037B8F9CE